MSYRQSTAVLILFVLAIDIGNAWAQDKSTAMYRTRRTRAMQEAADAILLVRSRPTTMGNNENGFRQEPAFYYLTGLGNAVGALLVMDSRRRETWLFAPEPGRLPGFGAAMHAPNGYVELGPESAARLGLEHVVSWSDFAPFLDQRLAEDPALIIRGPFRDDPASATPARLVGQDDAGLWENALRARWPQTRFGRAPNANALRAIKDPDEVAVLRRVGASSATALLAGLAALRPGRRQREAEIDVLAACVRAGADRVSFWPWLMTGANSDIGVAIQSLADDHFLDRTMRAGELARVDVGCSHDHYEGDVGRTAPVSGRFDPGQREAWDLFVSAYRTALDVFKPGRTAREVFAAWQGEFERRRSDLQTSFAKRTAEIALSSEASRFWQMHGVGVADAEGRIDTLNVGQVLAFEPILTVDGVGLYLEDMILVTPAGAEVLTKGLPYSSVEIENAMKTAR